MTMTYIAIFSYEEGDFLTSDGTHLLLFDSRGLALQYLREHFQLEQRKSRTKRFNDESSPCFVAPFKLQRVIA